MSEQEPAAPQVAEPAPDVPPAPPVYAPPVDPHPEKSVGMAFGGGLLAALVLKSLAKRKHRR